MTVSHPQSTARIARHPLHPLVVPIPIVCFIGGLAADIAYTCTAVTMWADFAAWLITVGVIFGYIAALLGIIDFAGSRAIRTQAPAWPHAIGNVVVLILATLDMFIHSRDAWTSVVPWGLALSAVVVLFLLFTGWMGNALVYRHGVGVAEWSR